MGESVAAPLIFSSLRIEGSLFKRLRCSVLGSAWLVGAD
jgi:hypothetical protein